MRRIWWPIPHTHHPSRKAHDARGWLFRQKKQKEKLTTRAMHGSRLIFRALQLPATCFTPTSIWTYRSGAVSILSGFFVQVQYVAGVLTDVPTTRVFPYFTVVHEHEPSEIECRGSQTLKTPLTRKLFFPPFQRVAQIQSASCTFQLFTLYTP